MSIWHTATTGNDANSGVDLANAKLTVGAGIGLLAGGDTLIIHAGTYAESIVNSLPSGSVGARTTIQAFTGDTVWLTGGVGVARLIYFGGDTIDPVVNPAYIDFDHINLSDIGNITQPGCLVSFDGRNGSNPNHFRFMNYEVINDPPSSTYTSGAHQIYGSDNEFLNATVHGIAGPYAFYMSGDRNIIDGCDIYGTALAGIQVYSGLRRPTGNIIRNSRIHDLTQSFFFGNPDPRMWGIIVHNSDQTQIYNNRIYGINFAYGPGNAAVAIGRATGTQVLNNTIYNNTTEAINVCSGFPGQAIGTVVQNNLSYGNTIDPLIDLGTGTIASNNLEGVNPGFVDPGNDVFYVATSSPAVNAGVPIPVVTTTDAEGNPMGATPDIGALQSNLSIDSDVQWTTNPQKVAPAAAASVTVTPSGSAWTWGAWAELTPALSLESAITGVILRRAQDSTTFEHEIEIGVGAGGSEVAIACFKGISWWFGNPNEDLMNYPLKIPCVVPAGSRVAVRVRQSNTDTTIWKAAVTYVEMPIVGNLLTTTSGQLAYPSGSAMISIAAVGSWTSSAWSELLAAAPADLILTGLAVGQGGGSGDGPEADMEIGIGAAASEVPITSVRIQTDQPCIPYVALSNPLDAIPAGSRIAGRVRSGDTRSFNVAIHCLPKPL